MSKVKTPKGELSTVNGHATPAKRHAGGAPKGSGSKYTRELGEEVCERVLAGESLERIAAHEHMPSLRTLTNWKDSVPEFSAMYAHARSLQADTYVDRMVETAWSETSPGDRRVKLHALEQAAKLIAPRRYGTQYTDATHTVHRAEIDREAILLAAKVLSEDIVEAEYSEVEAGPPPQE